MKALDVIESQGSWLLRHSHQLHSAKAAGAAGAASGPLPAASGDTAAPRDSSPSAAASESAADGGGKSERQLTAELWLAVLRALARASTVPNQHLRNHAIQALHGCAPRGAVLMAAVCRPRYQHSSTGCVPPPAQSPALSALFLG